VVFVSLLIFVHVAREGGKGGGSYQITIRLATRTYGDLSHHNELMIQIQALEQQKMGSGSIGGVSGGVGGVFGFAYYSHNVNVIYFQPNQNPAYRPDIISAK